MIVTSIGAVIPTVEELYQEKINNFKTIKPNLRETDSNIIVSLFKFDAAEQYDLYQETLSVYNNLSVLTAVGQGLNAITMSIGMTWLEATRSKGMIQITAETGTIIPAAYGVETLSGKKYITRNTTQTVVNGNSIELEIISIDNGISYNTGADTVIKQTEVISGIKSITNRDPITGGRDKEIDTELRERYIQRINQKLTFTTEGIKKYLLDNTDIIDCKVFENDKDIIDEYGRLPHSYEAICYGGTDEEIFTALKDYKLAGIRCVGENTRVYDGISIGFSRAEVVNVGVELDVKFNNSDPNNEILIRETIKNYVSSCTFGETIFRYVIIGELYKLGIGIDIINLKLGEENNLLNDDYVIPNMKVAEITNERISIRGL